MYKLFAGVDGGGSKTMAVVVDAQGRELGRGKAGASNYQAVGFDTALGRVKEALAEAMAQAGADFGDLPTGLVMGMAGVDRPEDLALWQSELADLPPLADKVEVCGDMDLILYSLPERRGLGIIAGTGSIAVGRDGRRGSQRVRAGGWGHFMGDEGSGLWLGRQALNASTRAADGRGVQTELLPLILKAWGLKEPNDLIGAVYSTGVVDNAKVARLSELVFRAAEAGDDFAKILLHEATNELALAIKACDRQLFFEEPPSLAISGGLLLNHPAWIDDLKRKLETMMTLGPLVRVDDPALVAAKAAVD